jgi:hypothetical protein
MHDVVSVQNPLIDLRASACVLMCRVASRSFLAQGATDILKPLGLGEGAKFPLSPKSERAYTRISHEFDVLLQALQAEADVTHSDPPVRPPLTATVFLILLNCGHAVTQCPLRVWRLSEELSALFQALFPGTFTSVEGTCCRGPLYNS